MKQLLVLVLLFLVKKWHALILNSLYSSYPCSPRNTQRYYTLSGRVGKFYLVMFQLS